MSEERVAWIKAFHRAQRRFPSIGKETTVTVKMKEGGTYSYTYATLPDILDKVLPILSAEGFVFSQSAISNGSAIGVETRLYHESGHVEVFGPVLINAPGDAKAAGSAITYARRYALTAALGIAPDEDDDGQAASEPPPRTPKQWVWDESTVFKGWNEAQRKAAAKAAMEAYAFDELEDMEQAQTVLEHMRTAYEAERDAEQGTLV